MRVTSHIQYLQSRESLRQASGRLAETQVQAATGKRISRPSDDPVAAGEAIRTRSEARSVDQSVRNIEAARRRMTTEEDVLSSVTDLLTRVKELGTSQVGGTASPQTRAAVKAEVDQLFEALVGLGNTRQAGAFLFGGNYSDQRPFDAAGNVSLTTPPVGVQDVDLGSGVRMPTSHDGQTVFVDSGALDALRNMSAALAANDDQLIADSITDTDKAINSTQELLAETGARWNRLDETTLMLEDRDLALETRRADLEEADLAEVLVELATRQTALQTALVANARASELTLANYL